MTITSHEEVRWDFWRQKGLRGKRRQNCQPDIEEARLAGGEAKAVSHVVTCR